jgi:membrane-associated phospholipid phosphatase
VTPDRFIGLPPRAEAVNLGLLAVTFALTFAVLYGAGSAWSAHVPWRVAVALPLDSRLPFWPAWAAIYLTISPMLLLAPFVLRDLARLLPLFAALMLETLIAFWGFMLLPVDPLVVTCCDNTLTKTVFDFADAINLERNDVPSLHVAFAVTAALAFAPRAGRVGAGLLFLWALAVAASTLLTRQHFIVDVIAGIALAVFCWHVAGRWARRADVLSAFDAELLALRNFARFSRRHRRYFFISLAVLAAGVPRWRRQRLARTGFAFLQAIDDVLDGDRASDREPVEVADELIASLESGAFASHDLARLGAAFRAELLARGGPVALETTIRLVRAMRRDRQRVLAGEILDRAALDAQHRATFEPSVDLLLLAADSPLRAADVPDLISALAWCSTVRDLDADLARGLINIPADVMARARTDPRAVREWLSTERQAAIPLLDACDARIAGLRGQRGAKLLARFSGSMRRYTRA